MLHLADLRISVIDPRLPLWKQRSITCDHLSTCDQNHLWMQKSIKDQRLPRFPISRHHLIEYQCVREDINGKKSFLSGIARMRGGVYPCPDYLAPFFYQVTVLKMAIFYSNFTVIVCFLVIFVIIIIKITTIIIIIIIATIIIIIEKKSVICAKHDNLIISRKLAYHRISSKSECLQCKTNFGCLLI